MISADSPPPGVSFVIPCLNEQAALPHVLNKLLQLQVGLGRASETIVADNGSSDQSPAIAQALGARVVHCARRGYGAAIKAGIAAARFDIIVFFDADNTYDVGEAPRLLAKLCEGYDIVVGSRLDGRIHTGAMPFLHRYLGTPVLNFFINLLFADRHTRVRDCNSGFRAFRKSAFESWNIESDGMEFASEMLIKALQNRSRFAQVPISLYPDQRDRVSHLQTWRDGMRHFLQVLTFSPQFFGYLGGVLFLIAWLIIIFSYLAGPVSIGPASLFEVHTMMFAMLISFFGQTIWGLGLFIAAKRRTSLPAYDRLVAMDEAQLFWTSVTFALICFFIFLVILNSWISHRFSYLALQKETALLVALGATGLLFVFQCFGAHMLKRA